MTDVIKLLPESIANQIAAGEVIQRPASVVKELMENAIDAGSTNISLVIRNSGKTLIQVIDNGKGMTETDARMSFERHATSKISTTNDLFNITTMGFRGEALASIASIAEVELKTRPLDAELGTKLVIRSSEVISQGFCQAEGGTTISVKNLFFNVPARRKFLKTDSVELKYILEEFKRVVLAHPDIRFRAIHNDNEIYNLPEGSLKKRILSLFRKTYEDKLIRIEEDTDAVKILGFVGNPEIGKKQRGEQYLFINKRFVKSNYLSHAIKSAYQNLLEEKQYPFYLLHLEIDPAHIDINVHPTKQEIKFDDERLIYNYLKVSIKHGLGRYSLSPQLDFNHEDQLGTLIQKVVHSSGNNNTRSENPRASKVRSAPILRNWQSLYTGTDSSELTDDPSENDQEEQLIIPSAVSGDLLTDHEQFHVEEKQPTQIHNAFILVQIKSGLMFIDQHHAHVRILYEKYLSNIEANKEVVQKQLFPITITVSKDKAKIFAEIIPEISALGFEIQNFGGDTYLIQGIPPGFTENNIQHVMDELIEQFGSNLKLNLTKNENIARSMAFSSAIKKGRSLEVEEMKLLIDDLFGCEFPYSSPSGKKCFISYGLSDLDKLFN